MPIVTPDIIEGNGGRFTIKGWEFSRVFNVSELTSNGEQMLVEATTAAGMPLFGESHPEIPTAFAIEFNPESIPDTGNAARVTVMYKEFAQDYIIELGTRKLMRPTTDYIFVPGQDRIPMQLYYTYPDDYEFKEKLRGKTESQGAEIEVQEYFSTIVITRTEFTSISADALAGHPVGVKLTGEMLTDRGNNFNGRLNDPGWNLRPSDPADVWRCEMTAVSAEDGLAYRVRYMFSFDPDLWKAPATYKDPFSGEPVPDPERLVNPAPDPLPEDFTFHNFGATRKFKVLEGQDFSLLELPV